MGLDGAFKGLHAPDSADGDLRGFCELWLVPAQESSGRAQLPSVREFQMATLALLFPPLKIMTVRNNILIFNDNYDRANLEGERAFSENGGREDGPRPAKEFH